MPVLALGISFRRAPVDLLERLAFADDDLVKAYRRVEDDEGVDGAVILSTCNRVEVYGSVASYHAGFLALKRLLAETRGVADGELAEPLYAHWERDAAEHLFAVAGGLDSMVLGETQIQSQVREALRVAAREGAADANLTGLFHAAARAGRRIRQETSIGAAPDAFVRLATDRADAALGGVRDRRAVVVRAARDGRGTSAPLVLIDLAVPHDVEPAASSIEGVTLIDVGALRSLAPEGDDATVARARAIVEDEVRRFVVRRRGDELAPLIRAI